MLGIAGCDFDGGDCCAYEIINSPSFGDGECNGGEANTEGCSYDNGDCNDFRRSHPDCPLTDLSMVEGADDVILGDGVCDSGLYNSNGCGHEFGDCNRGQIGQPVI